MQFFDNLYKIKFFFVNKLASKILLIFNKKRLLIINKNQFYIINLKLNKLKSII